MRVLPCLSERQRPAPYDYKGTLRGLLELFISVHNNAVEEKKRFVIGNVTVTDNNDYVSYRSIDFSVTLDAIRDKLMRFQSRLPKKQRWIESSTQMEIGFS